MRYHVTVHYRTPKHPRIYRLDVVSLIPQTFTKGN